MRLLPHGKRVPRWLLGLILRADGAPRYLVRKALFDANRRPKKRFRSLVQRRSGAPRGLFAAWMADAGVGNRLAHRFERLQPLPVFEVPGMGRRVVAVVDGVDLGGLDEGVGAALILAALLANRLGVPLCIATRSEPAARESVIRHFQRQNIALPAKIDFFHAPPGGANMPIGRDDLFITTSWWNTQATLRSIAAERVTFLVRQDERILHPHGDDLLRCLETLGDPRLRFVVTSRFLFDHLAATGLANIAARGSWFEPAFPASAYSRREPALVDGRRNFVFHARPGQPQYLYHLGLEVLDAALARGVLDPAEWNISFVGRELEEVIFPGGVRPALVNDLADENAAGLIAAADLGLTLNHAPYPGRAPLALAAGGAVAVTNQYAGSAALDASANIICARPDVASLVDALARGVDLARDTARRRANHESQSFQSDWAEAFARNFDAITAATGTKGRA